MYYILLREKNVLFCFLFFVFFFHSHVERPLWVGGLGGERGCSSIQ